MARVGFAQSPSPKGFSLSLSLSLSRSLNLNLSRALLQSPVCLVRMGRAKDACSLWTIPFYRLCSGKLLYYPRRPSQLKEKEWGCFCQDCQSHTCSSFGIGVSSFFYFTRCFRRPGNGRQLHLIFHMSCAHIIGRVRIAHKAARQLFTGKWTPVTKLITITLQVCMGLGLRLTRARGSTTIIYILV